MSKYVKHPEHYNSNPSGIECWDINEHLNGNLAAVFKYVYRRQSKGTEEMNLEKAIEYLHREVKTIERDDKLNGGMRRVCQPGTESFLKEKLSEVIRYETSSQIVRFYESLIMLVFATRPATRMVLCHTLAGGLNSYLTDLDEAAVKCAGEDLVSAAAASLLDSLTKNGETLKRSSYPSDWDQITDIAQSSGFLDGFDSSTPVPLPTGAHLTRGGSTSNTSQE